MKITIIGYGKMGHAIEEVAKQQNIDIVSIIDPTSNNATHKSITAASIKGSDVAIDFTKSQATLDNVEKVAGLGSNIVVGTTGWYDDIEKVKKIVKKHGVGLVYSPNFSIGVNLFFRMVENASAIMNRFPNYDPFIYEIHHRQKTDAPGGTAKRLGEIVIGNINRKKKLVFDRVNGRKIASDELHLASIRAGYITGTHVVGFDGEYDTIELKHTAKSRTGYAQGAITAAQWVKNRKGIYTFDEVLANIIGE